jgi:hypothetical protein
MYFQAADDGPLVKAGSMLIKTGKKLFLKYANHYSLPKGKE